MTGVAITVPVRTRNQLNRRRHWRVDARERDAVKRAVTYELQVHGWDALEKPTEQSQWDVTLVRLGPRVMDDDGVVSALKSVRDAFAKFVGVDDRRRDVIRYLYDQEQSKEYGVRIEVRERRAAR